MDKRILIGGVVALAVLLVFDLVLFWTGAAGALAFRTPLGSLPMLDVVAAFGAMALGGAIARHRFQWIAVAVSLTLWVLTFALLGTPSPASPMTPTLPEALRFNALAIALTVAAAWAGAFAGERWAQRRAAA
ncbi:hypothetical protein ACFOED_09970 [Vulcaniibacterium thermophilum]|uniref:Uncharacterized protein n=2 Tax=Gammaproteobacteria TaxID=1236 RepID=A0A919DHE6_9GAMM|nr:hypothetical protein [Vulcaniibacterium thermophilum]GHE44664.1 hypothetical protein GCM10007167_27910 [Vulcaniibacterium thermophilum]